MRSKQGISCRQNVPKCTICLHQPIAYVDFRHHHLRGEYSSEVVPKRSVLHVPTSTMDVDPAPAPAVDAASAEPVKTSTDTWQGVEYNVIEEGKARILYPKGGQVFYNPIQEYNRDMSVMMLRLFAKEWRETRTDTCYRQGKQCNWPSARFKFSTFFRNHYRRF